MTPLHHGLNRVKIILKVTKKQGSTLSIEDTFFKKPLGEEGGGGGGGGSIQPQKAE